MKNWWKSGDPWIWLTAASVTLSILAVVGLLFLIAVNGLGHFWPKPVLEADYESSHLIGEIYDQETVAASQLAASGLTLILIESLVIY
jgi:phosphate transport system permease protein